MRIRNVLNIPKTMGAEPAPLPSRVNAFVSPANAPLLQEIQQGLDTQSIHRALRAGVWGQGVDRQTLWNLLLWKSPTERAKLNSQYSQQFGVSLEEDVSRNTRGRKRQQLLRLLDGQSTEVMAEWLHRCIQHRMLDAVFDGLNRANNAGVLEEFSSAYQQKNQRSLDADVRKLGYFASQRFQALKHGGVQAALAVQLREILRQSSSQKSIEQNLLDTYSTLSPQAAGEYQRLYNEPLSRLMRQRVSLRFAEAFEAALASPASEINEAFLRLQVSPSVDTALEWEWACQKHRGPLDANFEKAKPLCAEVGVHLPLTPAAALSLELSARPVRPERILERLASLSPQALEETLVSFQQDRGQKLQRALSRVLTGSDWVEARVLLGGSTEGLHEEVVRETTRHALIRKGMVNFVSKLLIDRVFFIGKGLQYDKSLMQLREAYQAAASEGKLTEEEVKTLLFLISRASADSRVLLRMVKEVRQIVASALGLASATFASRPLLDDGAFIWAAAAGLGASIAARVRFGLTLEGGTYSQRNLWRDIADGISFGAASVFMNQRGSAKNKANSDSENLDLSIEPTEQAMGDLASPRLRKASIRLTDNASPSYFSLPFSVLDEAPADETIHRWALSLSDGTTHMVSAYRGNAEVPAPDAVAKTGAILECLAKMLAPEKMKTLSFIVVHSQ